MQAIFLEDFLDAFPTQRRNLKRSGGELREELWQFINDNPRENIHVQPKTGLDNC